MHKWAVTHHVESPEDREEGFDMASLYLKLGKCSVIELEKISKRVAVAAR